MKLSVTLEPEVYALAEADDISLSAVFDQTLRDSFFGVQDSSFVKNGQPSKDSGHSSNGAVSLRKRVMSTFLTSPRASPQRPHNTSSHPASSRPALAILTLRL